MCVPEFKEFKPPALNELLYGLRKDALPTNNSNLSADVIKYSEQVVNFDENLIIFFNILH